VFKTADSRPDFKLDESLAAEVASAPNHELVLREAAILLQPQARGVRIVFRIARNLASAIGVTLFLAIWSLATWAMHDAAPIMTIIFGLIDVVVLYFALVLWFYRSVAEASPSALR